MLVLCKLPCLQSLMSGTSKNGKVVEQIEKLSRDLVCVGALSNYYLKLIAQDTALQEKTNAADQLKVSPCSQFNFKVELKYMHTGTQQRIGNHWCTSV